MELFIGCVLWFGVHVILWTLWYDFGWDVLLYEPPAIIFAGVLWMDYMILAGNVTFVRTF